jgi:hypothetical protein
MAAAAGQRPPVGRPAARPLHRQGVAPVGRWSLLVPAGPGWLRPGSLKISDGPGRSESGWLEWFSAPPGPNAAHPGAFRASCRTSLSSSFLHRHGCLARAGCGRPPRLQWEPGRLLRRPARAPARRSRVAESWAAGSLTRGSAPTCVWASAAAPGLPSAQVRRHAQGPPAGRAPGPAPRSRRAGRRRDPAPGCVRAGLPGWRRQGRSGPISVRPRQRLRPPRGTWPRSGR